MDRESFEGPNSVRHVGRGDQQHMWKPLRIHAKVAFDPRHQLAAVKSLLFRRVRVFDALRVHDEEAGVFGPAAMLPDRANYIFLTPLRGALVRVRGLVFPLAEIRITTLPRRKISRQHAPLTATLEHVEHAAKDLVEINLPRTRFLARPLKNGHNDGKLFAADIAGIG